MGNDRQLCHCLRCGWIWFPRQKKSLNEVVNNPLPKACPKCGSRKWQFDDPKSVEKKVSSAMGLVRHWLGIRR